MSFDDFVWMLTKLVIGLVSMLLCMALTRGFSKNGNSISTVQNFVFGGIIGGVIYSPDITLVPYGFGLLSWTGLIVLVQYLSAKFSVVRNITYGRSWSLYEDGRFSETNLQKTRTPITAVIEDIFKSGELSRISSAQLTEDGAIDVKLKSEREVNIYENGSDDFADKLRILNLDAADHDYITHIVNVGEGNYLVTRSNEDEYFELVKV